MSIVNTLEDTVSLALEAVVRTSPHVATLSGYNVVVRKESDRSKVALVSGGGSGHEPSHASWVGDGMLTAAVAGSVFASPSTAEVLAAILHVTGPGGCLVIVKNYTGDRLNFGIACEQAKACGLAVEMVVVGEDCALAHRSSGIAGRRGLAGTIFVHKIAGAAAAAGASLQQVAELARAAAAAVGTLGVALRACKLPGKPREERIADGTLEIGLGIHGEPGAEVAQICTCESLVRRLLALITSQAAGRQYLALHRGEQVALMVNNLGSTSMIEMSLVTRDAISQLEGEYGVQVARCYTGTFMSALDMSGFSISILKLTPQLLGYLDAAAQPQAWPAVAAVTAASSVEAPALPEGSDVKRLPKPAAGALPLLTQAEQQALRRSIAAVASAVLELEAQLTLWDTKVGDGDCGTTLKAGALAVLDDLPSYALGHPLHVVAALGFSIGRAMGGTSGVLYKVFLSAAGAELAAASLSAAPSARQLSAALAAGADAISRYGGATAGDRTMLDALQPAGRAMCDAAGGGASMSASLAAAADAARSGAESTKLMAAAAGRSSYIPEEVLRDVPDPGAMAVACWLTALADACS